MLKADAYGLGAPAAARAFLGAGADLLAVACLPEALELRRAFPEARILVMGHTPDRFLATVAEADLECTLFDLAQARRLSDASTERGTRTRIHVKIDTGMNRLGIKPGPDTPALLEAIASLPGLAPEGIFTHLALRDAESDRAQFDLFAGVLEGASARGIRFALRHVCDSIGLVRYPGYRLDMVRAGAILYGLPPLDAPPGIVSALRLPVSLKTRISRLRRVEPGECVSYDRSWIAPPGGASVATVPVGYADGYRRCMGNRARVLVRGLSAPVIGLVCMDQCTIDVSGIPGVAEGDEVVLLGRGPAGGIPVLEAANWAKTNRNEILCSIGRRVPRIYLRGGLPAGEADYLAPATSGSA